MTQPRRARGTLLPALLLVVGCMGTPPATSPSPSPGGWVPETAWERALEDIGPDGRYSLQAALTLFATAFGPLPGVDVATDQTGIEDRTPAIRAVMDHADELTAEQRQAVEQHLQPPADAELIVIPPVEAYRGEVLQAAISFEEKSAIFEAMKQWRADIAARLGSDFAGELQVSFKKEQPDPSKPAMGNAWSDWSGGVFGDCQVTIFALATDMEPSAFMSTLAHEVFHCFQYDAYRTMELATAVPDWVIEGQASWVGETLGKSGSKRRAWERYLTAPYIPLTQRSYDAIGFYGHLDHTGTDPWAIFRAMWNAGTDNFAIFEAANANTDAFIDTWASGLLREPDALGSAWDTDGPQITDDKFLPPGMSISNGSRLDVSAAFFTNDADYVAVTADLLHMEVDGHGRLSDGAIDTIDLDNDWFCIYGKPCVCPDGEPLPVPIAGTLSGDIAIAASGGSEGTVGWASGVSREDLCDQKSPSPSPTPEPSPDEGDGDDCDDCAMSNGDPHLVTVDGHDYDFMAAGEFVLLRSSDGSFELQGRQVPLPNASEVTVNSAIAMRVGERRLTITVDDATDSLTVLLDGSGVDAVSPLDLGAGATLETMAGLLGEIGDGYVIRFADGTRVHALGLPGYGITLMVDPSDELRASGVGVLGPIEGDDLLPALPDGTAIDTGITHDAYLTALYGPFADAWRVTQATSLFDYEPGQTTATFTIPNHPGVENVIELPDLTPEQRAAGEAACRHITVEFLREQCVFDVGLTGDTVFAELYDLTVSIVEGTGNRSGERIRVVNLYHDGQAGIDLDVYAWTGNRSNSDTTDDGAALVTTVPYGTASDYFDPGTFINFDRPQIQLSMTARGEPLLEWAFNVVDTGAHDPEPGAVRTLVVTTVDPEDPFYPDGTYRSIDEASPYLPLPEPPEGSGLLFPVLDGLQYTLRDLRMFVSVGDGCLTQPDFPTLAQVIGPWMGSAPLLVPAGQHVMTFHDAEEGVDPFQFRCDTPPKLAGIPLAVAPADRFHVFLYTGPGSTEVQTLVVPVGE